MGTGQQGPQGPPGPQGPKGEPAVVDPNVVSQTLSTQTQFLNRLAGTITADTNIGSIRDNVVTKIMQSPTALSNTIAQNQVFQNLIGQHLTNESSALGSKIADGIVADPANTLQLASSIVSQGNFLNDLSKTLSDPNLPYAEFLRGPPGSISNIKTAIQPISMLCDTAGNCKTPQFGSYLNFTSGNLLLNNDKGIVGFRVAGDGGPWITGNSGGQLGTYNDNINTGTVAIKWDAQGNVIVGDIAQTTGSLKVGGNGYLNNLYATGAVNANDSINVNSTDGSTLTQFNMHLGGQDSHSGGTGSTDGSTFTITKNGPYRAIPGEGGKNAVLFNNYNNPMVFGDMTTSGNIFMLNNNENIARLPNGNDWYTSITGMNTSGNNSAIINNTGTIGTLAGSLMLVGNASADKATGTRVVSVVDRLQIGNWQLYEDNNGDLQFKDVRGDTPSRKITLPYIINPGAYYRANNDKPVISDGSIDASSIRSTQYSTYNYGLVMDANGRVNASTFRAHNLAANKITCQNLENYTNATIGNVKAAGYVITPNKIKVNNIIAKTGYIGYLTGWDITADGAFYGRHA